MHIVIFGMSKKGFECIKKIRGLCPDDKIIVFCQQEDPWEEQYFSDIFSFCNANGIVLNPKDLNWFDMNTCDLLFAIGWRKKIPHKIYSKTRSVVIHDSMLPKYRGFAPLNWAIINGEKETGVTLFTMEEDIDAGPIIDQVKIIIEDDDTIITLQDKAISGYLQLLEKNMPNLKDKDSIVSVSQDCLLSQSESYMPTYGCKRTFIDGLIDWNKSAQEIYNLIRALTKPWPCAHSFLNGDLMLIHSSKINTSNKVFSGRIPGRVWSRNKDKSVSILTGDGILDIHEVMIQGLGIIMAADIIKNMSDTLTK